MNAVIALRDSLRKLYSEYDVYLRPVLRFITAFAFLVILKAYLGIDEKTGSPLIILSLSAFCLFFPWGSVSFVSFAFVIAGMFAASYSMALAAGMLFILIMMLYFGFRPGNGIILILIPIGFILKVPYVVPLILGFSAGISSVIPAALGILSVTFMNFYRNNLEQFTKTTDLSSLMNEFVSIVRSVLTDKNMFVMVLAVTLTIIVVRIISRLSADHSWTISVISGVIVLGLTVLTGSAYLETSKNIGFEILSLLTALAAALIYEFLFFNVDYKKKEFLQFEDDEYYYYVKAVPKIKSCDEEERRE